MLQAIFFCKMLPLNRWERRITEISTYISYLTCLYIFCKIEGSDLRILREMKKRKKKFSQMARLRGSNSSSSRSVPKRVTIYAKCFQNKNSFWPGHFEK